MDVVYMLRDNTNTDEIRYSLRSVEKYLKNYDKIWVVGKPNSILNKETVNIIDTRDMYFHKQMNAINKILSVCSNPNVSDDFILMNDDFFFLKKCSSIKPYTIGSLDDKFLKQKSGMYRASLQRALKFFNNMDNWEVHYPLVINKKSFKECFYKIPWRTYSMVYRSPYSTFIKSKSLPLNSDFKVFNEEQFNSGKNRQFLSTSDKIYREPFFQEWLAKKFPKPSKYEV